nr:MAG TPA_asm: hypothetical protein [Bacteriophage sp.]
MFYRFRTHLPSFCTLIQNVSGKVYPMSRTNLRRRDNMFCIDIATFLIPF